MDETVQFSPSALREHLSLSLFVGVASVQSRCREDGVPVPPTLGDLKSEIEYTMINKLNN